MSTSRLTRFLCILFVCAVAWTCTDPPIGSTLDVPLDAIPDTVPDVDPDVDPDATETALAIDACIMIETDAGTECNSALCTNLAASQRRLLPTFASVA